MTDFPLTKRLRLDEIVHAATGTRIGIYVTKEGEFYARVPEVPHGEVVRARTMEGPGGLRSALIAAADRILSLQWTRVIRVTLASPKVLHSESRFGAHYGEGRWNPLDLSTAGTEVTFSYDRYEVAISSDGKRHERDWAFVNDPDFALRRVIVRDFVPTPGVCAEMPYSDALWSSLADFRTRIQELNHGLRTLIRQPNAEQLFLHASRQPLLTVKGPDVGVEREPSLPELENSDRWRL